MLSSALTSMSHQGHDDWSSTTSGSDVAFSDFNEFDPPEDPLASRIARDVSTAIDQVIRETPTDEYWGDSPTRVPPQPTPCVTPQQSPQLLRRNNVQQAVVSSDPEFIHATTPDDPFAYEQVTAFIVQRSDMHAAFVDFFRWLRSSPSSASYKFSVRFENEEACGNGVLREFFRLLWEDYVVAYFFEDNDVSGLPLPSPRLDRYNEMLTLGKFIALSIRHDYLPLQIHPLCYINSALIEEHNITWRTLAYLHDPIQASTFPKTFQHFVDLPVEVHEHLNQRYNFWTDICCFDEVNESNFDIVLDQFSKRVVFPFPVQRTLARLRRGFLNVKCFEDQLTRSALMLNDRELFDRFEAATNITAAMLLERTTFDFKLDKKTQQTYAVYRQTIESMTPQELKRWLLFVTNSTVPNHQMQLKIGDAFFVRTCFCTIQLGRQYASVSELREDLDLVMSQGLNLAMAD